MIIKYGSICVRNKFRKIKSERVIFRKKKKKKGWSKMGTFIKGV